MAQPLVSHLRDLKIALALAALAPAPALITARHGAVALMYFFAACVGLVAYAFRDAATSRRGGASGIEGWTAKLAAAGVALLAAWAAFTLMALPMGWPDAFVASLLALLSLAPALCVVPAMVLVTRNAFAAAVLSVWLAACMKLLGCVIVVTFYGWDASEHGHTTMPWLRPNLLVWSFLALTAVLSAACLGLSLRYVAAANSAKDQLTGVVA